MMDPTQKAFFKHWLGCWKRGQAIEVNGNISYLFAYANGVLNFDPKSAVRELDRLLAVYGGEKAPFPWYCQKWVSDFHLLAGDFRKGLDRYPELTIGATSTTNANEVLNIKRVLGDWVGARELLALSGPKVTAWAKKHLDEVVGYLDAALAARQEAMKRSLLVDWSRGESRYGWHLFRGVASDRKVPKPFYCYYADEEVRNFIADELREAENTVREEKGIPRVGEGWVAETTLYYEIRKAFPHVEVIHHARPEWLKPQHLDIFIAEFSLALEYQGAQHDKPIEFFGGLKQFEETQRRDAKKLDLCLENRVMLIYVREDYDLDRIVGDINQIISQTKSIK